MSDLDIVSEGATGLSMPEWMHEEIARARKLFMLDEAWYISIKYGDIGDEFDGECRPDSTYCNAEIALSSRLDAGETPYRRRVINHEMFHIVHAEIDAVVDKMLKRVHPSDRELLTTLYTEAVETMIQRVVRGISRHETERDQSDGDASLRPSASA